ncbi:MAG: endolysin [Pseudomonadota bacterium]
MSKVPAFLSSRLAALAVLAGLGGTGVYVAQQTSDEALRDQYVQTVAADPSTSHGVKVAMVLGQFYESSGKHIGMPYIDKLGRGQPLTVCNGITGTGVVAGRYYSPSDCYYLERGRYLAAEREARSLFTRWPSYDPFVQGQFIDFVHNKGAANLSTSTLLRKANAGDLAGACLENPRWNRGTVAGVSTVLPGLQLRGDSNAEICLEWRAAP